MYTTLSVLFESSRHASSLQREMQKQLVKDNVKVSSESQGGPVWADWSPVPRGRVPATDRPRLGKASAPVWVS